MWNAFNSPDALESQVAYSGGTMSSVRPDKTRLRYSNERSIIASVYTRLSMDVAAVGLRHIKLDDQGRYAEDIDSGLNTCLLFDPNPDQGPRAFRQDIAMTLFDKGVAAIVPVDTTVNPAFEQPYDIHTLRVGNICQWYPRHVRVDLYNIDKGQRQEVVLEKRNVAIVENPLYQVMNEPNSTLQRLIRKLNLLDAVDEQSSSGKLDIIIQLPYVIKSEARRLQAEQRRTDIEFQLKGSQYGIAYTDATEKITQLNRPAENNLLKQVEYLTAMLYGQLGLTEDIMNGTADEKTMRAYFQRTIAPILEAIIEAMQRSLLGQARVDKNERIYYFQNPFALVPMEQMAEIADKFTRNEILSANEIRSFMGLKPSKDPKADQLINSNMPQPEGAVVATPSGPTIDELDSVMNEVFNGLTADLDAMAGGT
jgi:hypothetical protein